MKRLLRSCIDLDGSISSENLVANFQRLVLANLDWSRPDDAKVYDFLRLYFQQRLELPSLPTARDYFEKSGDIEVLERLKDIEATPFYIRTGFLHLLESIQEEQNKIRATALLKESHEIINKGIHFQEGREKVLKKGIRDALMHFQEKAHNLLVTGYNAKTTGDIRQDGQAVWDQYVDAKINKDKVWGRLTGLERIDTVCHGIKKGELWVHAAAPGELKSTLAVNVCYNLVTRYRTNVIYYSFEMTYEQLRLQVYTLHSAHARWRLEGYDKPLDYRRVRDGLLDDREEEFLRKVIEDFSTNPEYCHFEMRCPDRNFTVDDVRLDAELTHKQLDVGFIVLDHGMLMEARSTKRSHDYVVELNSIIRDTKKLCLQFNHGEKIPILMLFQINRQGKEEASKNQGRYKTSALAYSNECVVGGTLVKTQRGLVPIEKVEVGDRVWSRSGWKDVLNTFDQGVRPTLRIETDEGFSLTVTPNHLLRVWVDGTVQWVQASDIKKQDRLVGTFGTGRFPSQCSADFTPEAAFKMGVESDPLTRVPALILQAPESHVREYIRGLWGTRGGKQDGTGDFFFRVSRPMGEDLQILLSDLALESRLGSTLVIHEPEGRARFECLLERHPFKSRPLGDTTRTYGVLSVVPQGEQQVYDIEVTGDHEYVTGGLLSHNCEKSADFITTTFLDEEHRRNGTTIVCNLKNRDNPIIEPFLAKIDFPSKRIYNLDLYQGADGSGMSADDHAAVLEAMANL